MKKITMVVSALCMLLSPMLGVASPEQDLKEFQAYYKEHFPDTPFQDFINGVYSIDPASREQWQSMEEFPPYEIYVDKGEKLFNTPFKNGKGYIDCFPKAKQGIVQNYPYFDTDRKEVITLELAINECRQQNGEEPLKYNKGDIAHLTAYLAYKSRGKKINVKIPNTPEALAWYERGKNHFYTKRGQLNMSCADCHMYYSGRLIRADLLSPALGHTSHFPAYRSAWSADETNGDGMGTLHRRYIGCNEQVRAKAFASQSEEYRALEFFHTYMSNGLTYNGPGSRK
jgi:sulfur-oxidizing protein SoxA